MSAIRVSGLGKEYTIGMREKVNENFREFLISSVKEPFRRWRKLGGAMSDVERFWALKDVSFEVPTGEVLGIIGRNGAGKSTLLKILSRITEPTVGEVEIRGRVASLLEVGTGFHPELSGRENIFLNGAILGMKRAEIVHKFDEIVAFAEVEKFIDTPVKHYSTGMYVRLAFAVAAHLEPDILVVDEVLAVGDYKFQQKCLSKMQDVSGEGRTILFVSHNMSAIQVLCSHALLLDCGVVLANGSTEQIIDDYIRNKEENAGIVEFSSGALQLISTVGNYVTSNDQELEVSVSIEIEPVIDINDLSIDFCFENKHGVRLLQVIPIYRGEQPFPVSAAVKYCYQISFGITKLAPGDYVCTLYAHSATKGTVLHISNIPLFSVMATHQVPESIAPGFTAVLVPDYQKNFFRIS
jgi:lipopolysaccharide transport system ATP-binding protein